MKISLRTEQMKGWMNVSKNFGAKCFLLGNTNLSSLLFFCRNDYFPITVYSGKGSHLLNGNIGRRKRPGERREGEEKTMLCASNVFLSFMNSPQGPNSDSDLSLPLSTEISLQPVHWLLQGESYFKSFYAANL